MIPHLSEPPPSETKEIRQNHLDDQGAVDESTPYAAIVPWQKQILFSKKARS